MPENPSNDDTFADLFRRLPSPARPEGGATGAPDSAPPVPNGDEQPTPGSRRAARAAAAGSTPRGSSDRASDPASDPTASTHVGDAAAVTGSPVTPPAASASSSVPALAATEEAASVRAVAPAAQPIEALFADHHDEDERRRAARHSSDRRKSRIAGWVVLGLILAILGGIVAGGFTIWNTYEDKIRAFMGWQEPTDYPTDVAEGEATVTIVTGDTGSSISTSLFDAGVTKTSAAFYNYLFSSGQNPTFQPGVYTLKQKMASSAVLTALKDPANRRDNTAQIPEGLTIDRTLQRLADGTGMPLADLQAAAANPAAYGVSAKTLEGWLFPATYTFDPGTSATQVIKTLVDRTVQSLDKAGVPADQRERILTIASIIQREARFTADFYKVSRVIENRLNPDNEETHGKLQMDSTAQYGYNEIHDGTASSSAAALEDDNPWNTYVHAGLPIGPIANPGDVAIDAALHPADGPWLYFVTVNLDTGETIFSTTYAEHEKAVAQWQQWCAANDSADC